MPEGKMLHELKWEKSMNHAHPYKVSYLSNVYSLYYWVDETYTLYDRDLVSVVKPYQKMDILTAQVVVYTITAGLPLGVTNA